MNPNVAIAPAIHLLISSPEVLRIVSLFATAGLIGFMMADLIRVNSLRDFGKIAFKEYLPIFAVPLLLSWLTHGALPLNVDPVIFTSAFVSSLIMCLLSETFELNKSRDDIKKLREHHLEESAKSRQDLIAAEKNRGRSPTSKYSIDRCKCHSPTSKN